MIFVPLQALHINSACYRGLCLISDMGETHGIQSTYEAHA